MSEILFTRFIYPNKGFTVQNHAKDIKLKEPSFFEIKIPVNLLILNFFIFQIIFHISTATLSSVAAKQNILSFEGLMSFTFDMWFIVILFSIGLFSYAKVKKQADMLLITFIALPALIALSSLMRNASSIIVFTLVVVISFLICRFNYHKLSTKYLEEAAKKNERRY